MQIPQWNSWELKPGMSSSKVTLQLSFLVIYFMDLDGVSGAKSYDAMHSKHDTTWWLMCVLALHREGQIETLAWPMNRQQHGKQKPADSRDRKINTTDLLSETRQVKWIEQKQSKLLWYGVNLKPTCTLTCVFLQYITSITVYFYMFCCHCIFCSNEVFPVCIY